MFWWDLKTVINGGQIFQCVLYHKCSHSSLHSAYGEGEKERQRVNVSGYHVLHTASPFQPSRLPWATVNEEALINHPYTGPVRPWHLQTLIFFFVFCPTQQPLLQINLGKLAFLMKIYRRLYPQTVNQLFPGTVHLFPQCELVHGTSPKLICLLWGHGYPLPFS